MARPKGTNTKSIYVGLRLSEKLDLALTEEVRLMSNEEGITDKSTIIRALLVEAIKARRNKRKTVTNDTVKQ